MTTWMKGTLGVLAALAINAAALAQDVVRVVDLGIVPDAAFYVAAEKGWFKAAGLDVRLEPFPSAVPAMAPLSTGDIHVLAGGVSPGVFNAFARGLPIKIVAPFGRTSKANSVDAIMVRSDLRGSVSRLADLKGRKIAVVAASTAHVYMLSLALEEEGLALKDVELVTMPFPDMGTALANKAIDAAVTLEPFVTIIQDRGTGWLLKRGGDVRQFADPGWQVAVVLYNGEWAQKNPRAANEFMVAYLRGAREFVSALGHGPNRGEVIDTLIRNTRLKDRGLYEKMHWGYIDPNGVILRDSLKHQLDWYVKNGMVQKTVDLNAFIDERYVRYALEKLGTQR